MAKWLVLLVCLSGCATTTYTEQMLPDGDTWEVGVSGHAACTAEPGRGCGAETLRPLLEARAKELCGKEPARMFACGVPAGSRIGLTCKVSCSAH